jgi:hypothetical protein
MVGTPDDGDPVYVVARHNPRGLVRYLDAGDPGGDQSGLTKKVKFKKKWYYQLLT